MKYRNIRINKDGLGRFCCGFMTANGPAFEFNFNLDILKQNIDKKLVDTIADKIYPRED